MATIKIRNGRNVKLFVVVLEGIVVLKTTNKYEALKLAAKINH